MALFQQYTQPGVYTTVVVEEAGISLFGDARIPVLIGEGQETRLFKNIELHRGSSAVADDRRVHENVSAQVTGFTREFTLACHPVVVGDGKGVITNDPKNISVYADGIPIMVSSLDGSTGKFLTQQIPALGTDLRVDYFFKREDTLVTNEDLSDQVPTYASYTLQPGLNISLSVPGASGNEVKLTFTKADILDSPSNSALANPLPTAKPDSQAVSGIGTNHISIEISKPVVIGNVVQVGTRSIGEIKDILIEAGIPTLSGGYLTASYAPGADPTTAAIAVLDDAANPDKLFFKGGTGPNTNRTFKLHNVPVVDGTNGGVVAQQPNFVQVTVNARKADVVALDGAHGVFTLAQPVPAGSVLKATYYTNRFQDTWDDLPAEGVANILQVGFAPDRSDFINSIDYVLYNDTINWGACAVTEVGQFTAGFVPFDGSVVNVAVVDEYMYLRPCTGIINGSNTEFELEDVPTTGSQRSQTTNDPNDIAVYAGTTPAQAVANGALRVIRLDGENRKFTLFNPPMPGVQLFANYHRCTLNDHTYTLEVVAPGIPGQGSYTITDENGNKAPNIYWDAASTHVREANFTTAGIQWPHQFPDLKGVPGQSPDEIITLTFQDDSLTQIISPSVQAFNDTAQVGLRFTATIPGVLANGTRIKFVGGTNTADNAAVSVVGEVITVQISDAGGATRTLAAIKSLFTTGAGYSTANAGRIVCTEVGTPDMGALAVESTAQNELFHSGAAAVILNYSQRFKVSSNRTLADAAQDGLGRTGNATTLDPSDPLATPTFGNDTPGTNGFLGQTYSDPDTGITFTIVDPNMDLDKVGQMYGYTELPTPGYHYRPGDRIVFKVSSATPFKTGTTPQIIIPGIRLEVGTTYGMFPTDTVKVHTYNKSGNEPKCGEFYYITYETKKTASDFGIKLFSNLSDVYAEYGDPVPTNRLSLAAKLMTQNSGGGAVFACVQVPKEIGMDTASDQTFMDAIADLAKPLPGSERKCDVIVPLSTSPVVQQFLAKHLNTEASPRKRGEAIGFLGMPFTAQVADARTLARSLSSERVVLIYPGGAVLSVDVPDGSAEFAVDGSFLAAAMCGMYINPAIDVATTLTRQKMVGFDRLVRRTEEPLMDLMASDGVCILTEDAGSFKVRHYISTRMDNPITREITCTTITDYVRQRTRKVLDQFVGRKNLQNVLNDIAIVQHSLMKSLIEQELVEAYKSLEVLKDDNDPTVVHVKLAFKPVFSLLWIDVAFRVSTRA
jgi:hypothetical protein